MGKKGKETKNQPPTEVDESAMDQASKTVSLAKNESVGYSTSQISLVISDAAVRIKNCMYNKIRFIEFVNKNTIVGQF